MNRMLRTALLLAVSAALWACGTEEAEHGHAHEDGTAHTHEPAANAAADDSGQGHAHGEDTHTHDAPETEAFYGNEAATGETAGDDEHAHGDETHTHSEPDAEHADDDADDSDQD